MAPQLEIEDRGSHLLFTLGCTWSAAQAVQLVERIGRRCDETLHRCVLVDITGVESRQLTRLTEHVAVNRGADVMATSDLAEALRWLLPKAAEEASAEPG